MPNHKTIGKIPSLDSSFMIPNDNYLKYFGDTELLEIMPDSSRSSCIKVGTFAIIWKSAEEYDLLQLLMKSVDPKEWGLILVLATYSIVCENNIGQYYSNYTYNHPSSTVNMQQYSDSSFSSFLSDMTDDQRKSFLNDWNAARNYH